MPGYARERDELIGAVTRLASSGVLSFSGHGNASYLLPDGDRFLLTTISTLPGLSVDQLAVVDLEGKVIEGDLDLSSREIVEMHGIVYRTRPAVGSVLHTHSPNVGAFAFAHKALPCCYEALLRNGASEDIPVAGWGPRGSTESINNIITELNGHPGAPAVLLANHGLLAFGANPLATVRLAVALEEGAEMVLKAAAAGGAKPLPEGALAQVRERQATFSR